MHVLVTGAGIAGLETLLGLRELAGPRVDLTLLAPVESFWYRPLSTAEPFTFREPRQLAIRDVARSAGAGVVKDSLVQVDADRARVLTGDGDLVSYDALVIATGAQHPVAAGDGLRWTRGPGGPPMFARVLREIEAGEAERIAFVVPAGAAWPPDAYELALIAARAGGRVLLLTAETAPLEEFGETASDALREALDSAGVELRCGVGAAHEVASQTAGADCVLSLPEARGPAVGGLAHDDRGFLSIDEEARVEGQDTVFAVGDATATSIKHSALAVAQADAAAAALAAAAGADVAPSPWTPVLYGILAVPPRFPGRSGSVWLEDGEPITHCLWWPPGHVTGRHLAPYVAARDPVVRTGLLWHPPGVPVAADVGGSRSGVVRPEHGPDAHQVEADARTRQVLAVRRAERAGDRLQRRLQERLDDFEEREREVIGRLEAAGYLRHG